MSLQQFMIHSPQHAHETNNISSYINVGFEGNKSTCKL